MPIFCSTCGIKVDDGYKFCLSCGAQLQTEENTEPIKSEEKDITIPSQKPISIEGYTQPSQPIKSKKFLFITLIAIIAIIIIVAVVLIFITGGVIDHRFVGEWGISDSDFETFNWYFESDGSLKITGLGADIDFATWNVKGSKLCLKMKENEIMGEYIPEGFLDEVCYDFEFSDGGNTVSLSLDGSENLVLTFCKREITIL